MVTAVRSVGTAWFWISFKARVRCDIDKTEESCLLDFDIRYIGALFQCRGYATWSGGQNTFEAISRTLKFRYLDTLCTACMFVLVAP